jgi:hypothetical protein
LKNKRNVSVLLFLALILAPAFYLETSSSQDLKSNPLLIGQGSDEAAKMAAAVPAEKHLKKNYIMELDERLVNTSKEAGYRVETYREYEIYKNQQGEVKEIVPTPHYEYIRYKIYK